MHQLVAVEALPPSKAAAEQCCYICSKPSSDHSVMMLQEDDKLKNVNQLQFDPLVNNQSEAAAAVDDPASTLPPIGRKMTIKDRA